MIQLTLCAQYPVAVRFMVDPLQATAFPSQRTTNGKKQQSLFVVRSIVVCVVKSAHERVGRSARKLSQNAARQLQRNHSMQIALRLQSITLLTMGSIASFSFSQPR